MNKNEEIKVSPYKAAKQCEMIPQVVYGAIRKNKIASTRNELNHIEVKVSDVEAYKASLQAKRDEAKSKKNSKVESEA